MSMTSRATVLAAAEDLPRVALVRSTFASSAVPEQALVRAGLAVLVETDGAQLFTQHHHADVVIAEVGAPGVGLGLVERLQETEATRSVPVVLVGPDDLRLKVAALELGAADYVVTSADPAELVARVRLHVRRAREIAGLRTTSLIDTLTDVYNRRGIERILEHEVERALRERQSLTVVFVDLDGFKGINDRCGHQMGDRVLATFARALAETVRAADVVGRLGGDEFLVVLPKTPNHGAREVIARIRAAAAQVGASLTDVPLDASVGLASLFEEVAPGRAGDTVAALIATADLEMYEEKRRHKLAPANEQYAPLQPVAVGM